MNHTVDTLMALAYKIRDARTYEWDVSEAVEAGNTLRAALTEALAQPVREPLTDEQIEKLRDKTFSINNPFCPVDSKSMRKAVRAIERAHGIGGDK
jgi:hypothetical protein